METLHDRLAALADDAPRGGAPAAELWARGKRAHRRRVATLAAVLLVVGAVGTGIGVRIVDRGAHRAAPPPAGPVHIALPIQYPVGEKLSDLGDTPGPLAAIWLVTHAGSAPEAVGLVAETGRFGTLPIDLAVELDPVAPESGPVALSPDGRRIAYPSPTESLIVHDLVSGEDEPPLSEFETRPGYTWVDATHLVGHAARGGDMDGWVWEPGKAAKLVNPYPYLNGYGGRDVWVFTEGFRSCSLALADRTGRVGVPVLCDALGFIGSEFVLGHENDPKDGNETVVALDIRGIRMIPFGSSGPPRDSQFDDPTLRHVVVTAGAPARVTFASDLIGAALDAAGGAS